MYLNILNAIPTNFKYATTLNFWLMIFLNLFGKFLLKNPIIFKLLRSFSFGIMITGSAIESKYFLDHDEILNLQNIIQHILPFTIYQFYYKKNITFVKIISYIITVLPYDFFIDIKKLLLNKRVRYNIMMLITIHMIIKLYDKYLSYFTENKNNIYTDYKKNVNCLYFMVIIYSIYL